MTGCEHEAQEIVADVIVERGVEIGHSHLLLGLQLATKLRVLALEPFVSAERVDRTVLRGGHEPSARVVRDARFRPLLERGDQSVLRELLGETDIAHDPRETGDDLGRLHPPDRIDGAMCVGSCHGHPSHHLQSARASPIEDEVMGGRDRKSTRLNSSHGYISYAAFCLKKKTYTQP